MGKRKLDQFDLEAEREGHAICRSLKCKADGRRISKQIRNERRGESIVEVKAIKRIMKGGSIGTG